MALEALGILGAGMLFGVLLGWATAPDVSKLWRNRGKR